MSNIEMKTFTINGGGVTYEIVDDQARNSIDNEVASRKIAIAQVQDAINQHIYYEMAVENVLCLGDSITEGACFVNDMNGTVISQNYPYYLGRILNCNVVNKGIGGLTISGCYKKYIVDEPIDFTVYDSVVIWLGTNSACTTMPTDSEIEGFAPETDPDADTVNHSLYLIEIIKTIQAENPDCFILLCGIYSPSSYAEAHNIIVQQIAKKYAVYYIDMTDAHYDNKPELHGEIDNVHLGKAGNIFVASRIANQIYTIIQTHPLLAEFGYSENTTSGIMVYTITRNLTNVYADNSEVTIIEGNSYTVTLTAGDSYELSSVIVIMNGVDITDTVYSNGTVSIPSVTGNITITATTNVIVSYTNQVPISIDTDGSIYNGIGYAIATRLSSSGVTKDTNWTSATGYIPASSNAEVRIKGVGWDTANDYVCTYDSSFTFIDAINGQGAYGGATITSRDGDTTLVTLPNNSDIAYIRVSAFHDGGDSGFSSVETVSDGPGSYLIVTVNEEIV